MMFHFTSLLIAQAEFVRTLKVSATDVLTNVFWPMEMVNDPTINILCGRPKLKISGFDHKALRPNRMHSACWQELEMNSMIILQGCFFRQVVSL